PSVITNFPNISSCATWSERGVIISGNVTIFMTDGSIDLSLLNSPQGIFVDLNENDSLYVADRGNKRILKFKQGSIKGEVVVAESDNSVFDPTNVYVDNEKNVYIGDEASGNIVKLVSNTNGSARVAGGSHKGDGLNQLDGVGIFIMDQNKNLYIADSHNHRIVKWEPNAQSGILIAGVSGENGDDSHHLHNPQGIFVDSLNDALYVADSGNHRIQKYHPVGSNMTAETVAGNGTHGNSLFQLNKPVAVIVDGNENIYVAEMDNHRIVKWMAQNYTAGGTCIAGCSKWGGSDLQFNRIQKFEIIRNKCD
ncbi:unnamed protein product, partial [Didymodactylos carnosus]